MKIPHKVHGAVERMLLGRYDVNLMPEIGPTPRPAIGPMRSDCIDGRERVRDDQDAQASAGIRPLLAHDRTV
jgi:hypothetical protein